MTLDITRVGVENLISTNFAGRQSCGYTFDSLHTELHRRNPSPVSAVLPARHALRGHRRQERSDAVRQAAGLHLRAGRDVADRATAHDSEPRLSGDLVHAAALVARPSHAGRARLVLEPHEISSHVPLGQQRSLAQTGTYANDSIPLCSDPYELYKTKPKIFLFSH